MPPKILSPNDTLDFSSASNFSSSFSFVSVSEDDVYVYDPNVPVELLWVVDGLELLFVVSDFLDNSAIF